jgi:hypothetical protein
LSLLSFSERERFAEREGRPLDVEEEAPNDMIPRLDRAAITEDGHGEISTIWWRNVGDDDGG